ncbi:MAG: hypothetical protein AAB540_04645 [Patescibacteria group bacterium]
MVRTQLYLPESLYKLAKKEAKNRKIAFAGVVRISLKNFLCDKPASKKKMTLEEKYPFIGMFKGGKHDSNNEAIDEFLLDEYER